MYHGIKTFQAFPSSILIYRTGIEIVAAMTVFLLCHEAAVGAGHTAMDKNGMRLEETW
jgi:hypothetical protein